MNPLELVLSKLPTAKASGGGWSAQCPAHDDRKPSLSIGTGDDGRVLLRCHSGCPPEKIVESVGLTMNDLFPPSSAVASYKPAAKAYLGAAKKAPPAGPVYSTEAEAFAELERRNGPAAAVWRYHDAGGEVVGLVARWDREDGKTFRPASLHPDGWRLAAMPDPRPLYRLPELATAKRVVVVEGEKCADAARSLGFVATTSVGGSQAAGKTDWTPLGRAAEIWILPDADTPGSAYATAVANRLAKLRPCPVVRIIDLPGLTAGGDIADWIEAHGDAAEPAAMKAELEALAATVTPEPAEDGDDDFKPFPVEALPEPIRGFVASGAKAIGCDPSFIALPLLAALASCVGMARKLVVKDGWYVPPIIWAAVVGDSGTAKTPAFRVVMRPIRERQQKAMARYAEAVKQFKAEYASYEKALAAWKRDKHADDAPPEEPMPPLCERFYVSDTTVEALAPILLANPRGVLLACDELAGWFGSFDRYAGKGKAGGDSSKWLSMYNGETVTVDRRTGIPPLIYIPQAAVSVCGGIQPGILAKALGDEHRESGLAARLLLAFPPRRAKKWTKGGIDPRAEDELARIVERLLDLQPDVTEDGKAKPVFVKMTPEAEACFVAHFNTHNTEQVNLSGDMAAAWSKLEEAAARLALVVHFVRWAANDVPDERRLDAESMTAGIVLTGWFKREARRVYAMLSEDVATRDERKLVEWIQRRGGSATAREVRQGCRWLKEGDAAEAALNELAKAGRGQWQDTPTTPRGGRPARVLRLHSAPAVYETPEPPEENGGFADVDTVDSADIQRVELSGGRLFPTDGMPVH